MKAVDRAPCVFPFPSARGERVKSRGNMNLRELPQHKFEQALEQQLGLEMPFAEKALIEGQIAISLMHQYAKYGDESSGRCRNRNCRNCWLKYRALKVLEAQLAGFRKLNVLIRETWLLRNAYENPIYQEIGLRFPDLEDDLICLLWKKNIGGTKSTICGQTRSKATYFWTNHFGIFSMRTERSVGNQKNCGRLRRNACASWIVRKQRVDATSIAVLRRERAGFVPCNIAAYGNTIMMWR